MSKKKNNYEIGKEMIRRSDLSVRAVKTFMGREGSGVNADLYFKNKKIGDLIDSGNGGGSDIHYRTGNKYMPDDPNVVAFLETLPEHTYGDRGYEFNESKVTRFNDEEMWDEIIDLYLIRKEFRTRILKKVAYITKNKVYTYKHRPSVLGDEFRYNGGSKTLKEIILKENKGAVILNELPNEEAFSLWYDKVYKKGI